MEPGTLAIAGMSQQERRQQYGYQQQWNTRMPGKEERSAVAGRQGAAGKKVRAGQQGNSNSRTTGTPAVSIPSIAWMLAKAMTAATSRKAAQEVKQQH
jgi:hypothetical protein